MQKNFYAKTANVKGFEKTITVLQNRPKDKMVGFGLISGLPGLGKTMAAQRIAFEHGYIYLRLRSVSRAAVFIHRLYEALYNAFIGSECVIKGTVNKVFDDCLDILQEHPEAVIMIDEVDYAFENKKLLGCIRDIVDETLAIVILIGMTGAESKLRNSDRHYFDRCNFFFRFTALTGQEYSKIVKDMSSIRIENDLIKHFYSTTSTNLRQTIKKINFAELKAKALGIDYMDLATYLPKEQKSA